MKRIATLALLASLGACGGDPMPLPVERTTRDADVWFVDEADARGLSFVHRSGQVAERWLFPEIMGGGAALFDADADGDLDAYLVQAGGVLVDPTTRPGNVLLINDGEGRFTERADSGADDRGYGMGVACGDVDRDGDVDLYVTNVGPNVLLLNRGDGSFDDVSLDAGVAHPGWGTSAAFVDWDGDGWLDLYVVNYLEWAAAGELSCTGASGRRDYCSPQSYDAPARDVLYRNLGGAGQPGVFEDVSDASGVAGIPATGLGVGCADVDGDGRPEIFVANDGMPDVLWARAADDDPWTLRDTALLAGCAVDHSGRSKAGMGVALGDVDDDDDVDLIVCNLDRQADSFFVNDGAGFFDDATPRAGLASTSRPFTRFGMGWVDFDRDGHLDLFQANGRVAEPTRPAGSDPYAEANLALRGAPGPRFEPLSTADGTAVPDVATSRAAAFGDIDGDGAVDVLVVNRDAPAQLLMNRAAGGHWFGAALLLETGAPALGATLRLTAGERSVRRDARAASSYLASNDPRVHVGLGATDGVSDVVVTWPDGTVEAFDATVVDVWHALVKGLGTPR